MAMAFARPSEEFRLERYMAKYEFSVQLLMCCSDCEPLSLKELLAMASPDMVERWTNLSLGYTESQGLPELRAEAAKLYSNITASNLVVCAPEEGIYVSMAVLLRPGDHVVAAGCSYQSLSSVARSFGATVSLWEPDFSDDTGPKFDVDKLQALVTSSTRMVVVNFPHNPTGYLPPPADFQRIVSICESHGAWLFSDEMYRLLEHEGRERLPNAADVYARAISLHGMSKTYSLPGLRLGWVASQDAAFLDQFVKYKDYTTICSSAPSEVLALIALQNRDKIVAANLDIIATNLRLAREFARKHADVLAWQEPFAGSVCFPRLKSGSGEDVDAFSAALLQDMGLLVLPGSNFSSRGGAGGNGAQHFRLGLGRRSFAEGLPRLGEWLEARRAQAADQQA